MHANLFQVLPRPDSDLLLRSSVCNSGVTRKCSWTTIHWKYWHALGISYEKCSERLEHESGDLSNVDLVDVLARHLGVTPDECAAMLSRPVSEPDFETDEACMRNLLLGRKPRLITSRYSEWSDTVWWQLGESIPDQRIRTLLDRQEGCLELYRALSIRDVVTCARAVVLLIVVFR